MAEMKGYRPPEGYLTMGQAQEILGISRVTIAAMVKAGKLKTYDDQRNKRVKLVKADDVEALALPVPSSEHDGQSPSSG
ncbi:MAG: helix-turn-helix domain-containing protein [Chloroflexi bacterium]|nr:helix-turn-helix domain-containing protein [Chloroflexota bacterium]